MIGSNRSTGKPLTDAAHLRQSIADILSTPLGSRVMRRDYGSQLPELIDQPFNGTTALRLYAATAAALMRWEPRIRVSRVGLDRSTSTGAFTVTVQGTRTDTGTAQQLSVPIQLAA